MKATLALPADFANQSADVHSEMKLVVRLEVHPAESEEAKQLGLARWYRPRA